MFAKLTSFVGGGSSLPFALGDPHPSAWGQWTHYQATLTADDSPASVFRISSVNKEDPKLRAARNGVKRLRMLRHPNILAFKEVVEVEEKGEAVIYLITEPVAPLAPTLRSLSLDGAQRDQYLAMGLNQVVSAVSFVNNDCKLMHGNVCAAAVVATPSLDWKLHGFDLTTEANWPAGLGGDVPIAAASWLVGAQYKAGEVARGDWNAVREGPSWAVDSWGLGCLIQELYSGSTLARTEDLRAIDHIPKAVLPYYQKLLSSTAARRLNPAALLEAGVLKNKLAETMTFLENLALKDALEKDQFFKRLASSTLPNVPRPVAQRKLLPLLAKALEFGGAPPVALSTLLTIGEGMEEEEYAKQVVPILTKLFASTDRGIRRGLLESIASFGPSLPANLVEEQIYPAVQAGFSDANPYLRELTLKSMVVLGPKLSQRTLNQGLLKHLAKLQVDEEPAIRANTTVLLGNLAPQLSEATCKKVLLNAFTRALKDTFPPARAAGIKAVILTARYHSPEEVAARVVPTVGPLCVDPVQEVRASALSCMEHYLGVLQANSKEMDRRAAEAAAAGAGGGGGGATGAGASGSLLSTGFGWAVSSLMSKGGGGEAATPAMVSSGGMVGMGPGQVPPPSPPPAAAARPSSGSAYASPASSRPSSAAGGAISPGWGGAPEGVNTMSSVAVEEAGGANGGWEDDEDPLEDMMDAVAAEMEARQRLSKVAVTRKPSAVVGGAAAGRGLTRGSARTTAGGAGAARGSRMVGGGMKLGAKKLDKTADDFGEW